MTYSLSQSDLLMLRGALAMIDTHIDVNLALANRYSAMIRILRTPGQGWLNAPAWQASDIAERLMNLYLRRAFGPALGIHVGNVAVLDKRTVAEVVIDEVKNWYAYRGQKIGRDPSFEDWCDAMDHFVMNAIGADAVIVSREHYAGYYEAQLSPFDAANSLIDSMQHGEFESDL